MSGELLKICALAVICVVVCVLMRQMHGDVSFAVRAVGGVMIFGILLLSAERIIDSPKEPWGIGGEYAEVMIKALGIAFLTHVTSGICRDCGESGLASGVELAGKLEILLLCLPLITEILGYAASLSELGRGA